MSGDAHKPGEADLDRRHFLRKAVVAGGTVWAVPTMISLGPVGAAELRSPPPTKPLPNVVDRNPPQVVSDQPRVQALAQTGADVDRLALGGLGTVAGGATLMYWSAARMKKLHPAAVEVEPTRHLET